jgi:hypothetical protein
VIVPYRKADLELIKREVQFFLTSNFGEEYKVTEAQILPTGYDGNLITQKCYRVNFSPRLRFVGVFEFSAFANAFYTHKDTPIDVVKDYCLKFLNSNYPALAPFTLERIETKDGKEGCTGKNKLLECNEMLISFTPLITTKWD